MRKGGERKLSSPMNKIECYSQNLINDKRNFENNQTKKRKDKTIKTETNKTFRKAEAEVVSWKNETFSDVIVKRDVSEKRYRI